MTLRDELLDTLAAYAAALRARDLDAALACFSDDAVVMSPLTPTASGSDVRDLHSQIVDASTLDITFTVEDLVADDARAALFTHSTGTRTPTAGGEATPVHSREAFVLLHQTSGWKIQRYLFNRIV